MTTTQITRHLLVALASIVLAQGAFAQTWEPVTDPDRLREIFSDTYFEVALTDKTTATAHYNADGSGEMTAWGVTYARTWKIENNQVCIEIDGAFQCHTLERNSDKQDVTEMRGTNLSTGTVTVFTATNQHDGTPLVATTVTAATEPDAGAAGKPSAEEMAAKLLNPANPIMKIGNNFDYVTYDGDLPGAGDQTQLKYLFLTIFPFKLDNGNTFMVRPAIPIIFDQGLPDDVGGFDDVGTDIADIGYDLIYTGMTKTGTLWAYGLAGTLPTASDDRLGKDLWGLGPEVMFGKAGKWGAVGALLSHQVDVAGSGSGSINLTSLNYFYGFPLKNGWSVGAGPTITYDHDAESGQELTLPLGVGINKTLILGGRPWQFSLQYYNNVVRPDAYAAEHTLRFGITPVVSAPWNKGK
jgi:hypothetical protein